MGESERDVCGFFTRDLRDCIEIFVASGGSCRKNTIMRLPLIESYEEIKIKKGESASRVGSSIRLDGIIRTNCIQITTNSIELRFDESSRTSLTGLSVLLSNEMFIFTLMNPLGSGLGRRYRYRFRVRPRSQLSPIHCYVRSTSISIPFNLKINALPSHHSYKE